LERGDVDAYMRPWADDGVMTSGRGPEPGPYDVSLARNQIEATRKVIFARLPKAGFEVSGVETTIARDAATVDWSTAVDVGDRMDLFRERYRLRRTPQGWRIVTLRYWPTGQRSSEGRVRFDERFFRDIDESIQQARNAHDDRQLLYLLVGAYRFREARA